MSNEQPESLPPARTALLQRRRLLLGAGAGAGLSLGGAAWALSQPDPDSGPAYRAWHHTAKGDMDDLSYMTLCATLAPSPHNTQPWRFVLRGDRIGLLADRSRHLGAADAQQRMLQLGLGCALENLLVAAEQLGYRARLDTQAADARYAENQPCAWVHLQRATPQQTPLFDAIFQRRTQRCVYEAGEMPVALREALGAADTLPGVRLCWLPASAQVDAVAGVVRQSVRDYLSPQRHAEGMRWFRIHRADWEARGDGISVFNGDAPVLVQRYVDLFTHEQDLLSTPFVQGEIDAVDRWTQATPHWGLIVAEGSGVAHRLQAGRLAERMYLHAARHGHAVQPLCYPTETPAGVASLRHLARIPDGHEPVFLFRLGRAAAGVHSVRRPLRDVLA